MALLKGTVYCKLNCTDTVKVSAWLLVSLSSGQEVEDPANTFNNNNNVQEATVVKDSKFKKKGKMMLR